MVKKALKAAGYWVSRYWIDFIWGTGLISLYFLSGWFIYGVSYQRKEAFIVLSIVFIVTIPVAWKRGYRAAEKEIGIHYIESSYRLSTGQWHKERIRCFWGVPFWDLKEKLAEVVTLVGLFGSRKKAMEIFLDNFEKLRKAEQNKRHPEPR